MLYKSSYYGISGLGDDTLAHHGIKGQKWGVKNGPPYPLSRKTKSVGNDKDQSIKRKLSAVQRLSNELDNEWTYGVIHNGKRINTEQEDFDWNNYRTLSLDQLKKEKIGTCWDFVNYQHNELNKAGIKNDSYLVMMDLSTKEDPDRIVTHTFTTFELGGQKYWLESAMYPKRGVHKINDFTEAAASVKSQYTDKKKPYSIFKYNPEGMDAGLTGDQFIEKATEGNWVMDVNNKRRR